MTFLMQNQLTMDIASSSQTKQTSLAAAWVAGALLAITGGGPIEGPPVFGPEAYECELANVPPAASMHAIN